MVMCNAGFKFQSTLPVGGATGALCEKGGGINISIHAPRGGSDVSACPVHSIAGVFQSTLPVGGATASSKQKSPTQVISIHAPRGGSDAKFRTVSASTKVFQSTLPVGGATNEINKTLDELQNFNPRSPWGERLKAHHMLQKAAAISIHAPRGGSDVWRPNVRDFLAISIHAPRGGSDCKFSSAFDKCDISIHAPRGGSDLIFLIIGQI